MISIIMPVYNSEKYLSTAIMSVLNQTYTNFELLLIDDGSNDDSGKICDWFGKKDNRIRVFHKENDGVCSARNFGLQKSHGEYIAFIDNDDEFDPNYLETFKEFITDEIFDILKCGRKNVRITPDLEVLSTTIGTIEKDRVYSFDKFLEDYSKIKRTGCMGSVWNGLYRKKFLEDNHIIFREDLKHGNEDLIFNYEALLSKPRIAFSSKVLYTHYYRISHSTSLKFYEDQIDSRIEAIKLERDFISSISSCVDQRIIEFEEIRECFRMISMCNDSKKRKELTAKVERTLDLSVLEVSKDDTRGLNFKQKFDWFLFKNKLFSLYFLYKRIQRKIL